MSLGHVRGIHIILCIEVRCTRVAHTRIDGLLPLTRQTLKGKREMKNAKQINPTCECGNEGSWHGERNDTSHILLLIFAGNISGIITAPTILRCVHSGCWTRITTRIWSKSNPGFWASSHCGCLRAVKRCDARGRESALKRERADHLELHPARTQSSGLLPPM